MQNITSLCFPVIKKAETEMTYKQFKVKTSLFQSSFSFLHFNLMTQILQYPWGFAVIAVETPPSKTGEDEKSKNECVFVRGSAQWRFRQRLWEKQQTLIH